MDGRKRQLLIVGLAAYAAVGVVTFGHAAASAERQADADLAECQRLNATAPPTRQQLCWRSEMPGMDGFLAGLVWPLYWSWEAQR